jgi:signal transduction histidine kinase
MLLLQNVADLRPGGSLNLEVVYLPDLIEEALDLIEPEFKGRVKVIRNYMQNLPGVKADRLRFEQMLLNLFKNAREAQADALSILIYEADGGLCLKITDNGEGIPQTDSEHIFVLWYTTRSGEGRGIGLYIVKTILDGYGWDIRIESKPGQGTSFIIFISPDSLSDPVKSQPILPREEPQMTTKPRALIVDDNADTLDLFRDSLALGLHSTLKIA